MLIVNVSGKGSEKCGQNAHILNLTKPNQTLTIKTLPGLINLSFYFS